jgi:hypothetical protein
MVSNKLIGLLSCGKAGFLLGFGEVVILASFRVLGKWWKRNATFMIFVKCLMTLRGMFLRSIFLMLLLPATFLLGRCFIIRQIRFDVLRVV